MKSQMMHRFSDVPNVDIPRSTFNRSHSYKTSMDAGYLIPFLVDEALPGDTFKVNVTGFARLSTPIYPIMDNLRLDTFFFAVPMRLLWNNFRKFMGEQVDPGDSIDYTIPIKATSAGGMGNMGLYDYMGLPTLVTASYNVNALPLRAYNLIWNEWFRDQNLQDSLTVDKSDGPDVTVFALQKRGKRHDYFTSCLPWMQKGDSVELSLGSTAPIETTSGTVYAKDGSSEQSLQWKNDGTNYYPGTSAAGMSGTFKWGDTGVGLVTNLATATASTVNELRQAIQIQRLLERDARSGTRYPEIILSHFGVQSDDARMQRPEYLGGGSTPVNITPIARTDSSPGELGAMGTSGFSGHGFIKSFTEHCYVIGICCISADLSYQEGLDRMWSRSTRYDFYWPTLAHLGEQAVLNKEIYLDATDIGDGTSEEVFGYQERYAEYRFKNSKITGKLRSNDAATLDAWHLAQEFGDTPTLDDTFIQEDPPVDRIVGAPSEPHFIFDSFINMKCTRPMPIYSVPGLIDHF